MTRRRIVVGSLVWLLMSALLVWRQYDRVIGNLEAQVIVGGWPVLGAAAWLKGVMARHHAERMRHLDSLHAKVDQLHDHLGVERQGDA